jgi:hypothetical protein
MTAVLNNQLKNNFVKTMDTMAEVFRVFLICYSKMQGQNFQHNTNAFFIILLHLLYTIILSSKVVK